MLLPSPLYNHILRVLILIVFIVYLITKFVYHVILISFMDSFKGSNKFKDNTQNNWDYLCRKSCGTKEKRSAGTVY